METDSHGKSKKGHGKVMVKYVVKSVGTLSSLATLGGSHGYCNSQSVDPIIVPTHQLYERPSMDPIVSDQSIHML